MSAADVGPLLVGEIFVDYTITERGTENKLRLGGITHAARGFWAIGQPFSAAAILPHYLEDNARQYFEEFGCTDFRVVGRVSGAPNVVAIFDPTEVADQEYEELLRDEKKVELVPFNLTAEKVRDILIFPGKYDLAQVCSSLPAAAKLHLDVAYDLPKPELLAELRQVKETIFLSTSSPLFESLGNGSLESVSAAFKSASPAAIVLKENRGGSRLKVTGSGEVELLPAQLGTTINSVGVGDVFAATYVSFADRGVIEAGWRATYAAAAYSQTTYPDQFKTYVERDLRLKLGELRALGGVVLPWEERPHCQIYLAAPDFTDGNRQAIDRALAALDYHNFKVRRPVQENGQLPVGSDDATLIKTFHADRDLLLGCRLVFAVPTGRDPGTLVEVGIAIEAGIPVVVYDPASENANTMVIAGATRYASELDACLNAVFEILGKARST